MRKILYRTEEGPGEAKSEKKHPRREKRRSVGARIT